MQKINELQLAKELIRFPSVTKTDAGVVKFLEKKLKKIGFKTKILEFKEKNSYPVKNLYARLGNESPNFCYAGHLDVVPPGNLNDWTINPFKPAIKKGYLIGRGANDMKSSIAAFVAAVSNFSKKNKKFSGSISLLITGDEEGIAINGTKKVVEYLKKRREKIDFCLVG
jgi:succinyl-diaminopimelate desuccinylase